MKKHPLILLLTLCTISLSGQTTYDFITIKTSFGVSQFYQYDKKMSFKKLVKMMNSNEKAYLEIRDAEYTHFMVGGLNAAGRVFILIPLITLAVGEEPQWILTGIGAGLLVLNIPFTRKFNKQVKIAVDTYNEGIKTSSFPDKAELDLALAGSGIGLQLRF